MSVYIDEEQRSDRPQSPCVLWVPAVQGHLRRWRSSTMYSDIACVAPRGIRPLRGAPQARRCSDRGPS